MAGVVDEVIPRTITRGGILNPILGGEGGEETSTIAPTSTPVNDQQRRPTNTPAESEASLTPTPEPDDEEAEDDEDVDDEDEAEPSPSPSPSAEEEAEPQTTFITSAIPATSSLPLPSEILPPATPEPTPALPAPEVTSAVSVNPEEEEELIVAPSPTSLPIPDGGAILPTTIIATQTFPASSSSTVSNSPGEAESATSGDGSGGNDVSANLMPALPISLGIVGGVLLVGVILGALYKKSKFPFAGRKKEKSFEDLDDGELEKQLQRRWDPRISRTWRTMNGATNF